MRQCLEIRTKLPLQGRYLPRHVRVSNPDSACGKQLAERWRWAVRANFISRGTLRVRPFVAALPVLNYLAQYSFSPISSSLQDWELAAIVLTALFLAVSLFFSDEGKSVVYGG